MKKTIVSILLIFLFCLVPVHANEGISYRQLVSNMTRRNQVSFIVSDTIVGNGEMVLNPGEVWTPLSQEVINEPPIVEGSKYGSVFYNYEIRYTDDTVYTGFESSLSYEDLISNQIKKLMRSYFTIVMEGNWMLITS